MGALLQGPPAGWGVPEGRVRQRGRWGRQGGLGTSAPGRAAHSEQVPSRLSLFSCSVTVCNVTEVWSWLTCTGCLCRDRNVVRSRQPGPGCRKQCFPQGPFPPNGCCSDGRGQRVLTGCCCGDEIVARGAAAPSTGARHLPSCECSPMHQFVSSKCGPPKVGAGVQRGTAAAPGVAAPGAADVVGHCRRCCAALTDRALLSLQCTSWRSGGGTTRARAPA